MSQEACKCAIAEITRLTEENKRLSAENEELNSQLDKYRARHSMSLKDVGDVREKENGNAQ